MLSCDRLFCKNSDHDEGEYWYYVDSSVNTDVYSKLLEGLRRARIDHTHFVLSRSYDNPEAHFGLVV